MKTLDSVAILIPVSFATILLLSFFQNPDKPVSILSEAKVATTPVPTIQEAGEVKSSDGTMKLTLIRSTNPDNSQNYDFIVTTVSKNTSKSIFRDTVSDGYKYTLPGNSWSNDNLKFFVQKSTPVDTKYYVFRADGSPFSDGQLFLDVGEYWQKSENDLSIKTLTGWADKDLIIIYTTKEDGSQGPSFWFVISSRKFIQLSNIPTD